MRSRGEASAQLRRAQAASQGLLLQKLFVRHKAGGCRSRHSRFFLAMLALPEDEVL